MNNLKKLTIATAVSAALGGIASVNAFTLGEPGGAVLVPYALCDTSAGVNTMVGLIHASEVGFKGLVMAGDEDYIEYADFPTQYSASPEDSTWKGNIHWFFFNERSVEEADGIIPVTKDDFVGFDWCHYVHEHDGAFGGPLDGLPGYLVFGDHRNSISLGDEDSELNLFADACVLQGNWGACAWDPALPMRDMEDDEDFPTITDEVVWNGGPNVAVINSGIPLGDDLADNPDEKAHFDLRYYVEDLGLGGNAMTDFIVWLDQNYDNTNNDYPEYTNLTVLIFDEDEVPGSTKINLPNELNVINASNVGYTTTKGSGFMLVALEEADLVSDDYYVGSAAAFSLIWFGPNPTDGVQTALAHNRGIW
jgi:hypothetical protein